jgi:tetratricopeptide (TPR) repeat protein
MAGQKRLIVICIACVLCSGTAIAGRAADVRTEAFNQTAQGISAYKQGDFDLAVSKLSSAADAALNSFRAHYYLGLALTGQRSYPEALEALSVALDLDPFHLSAICALGNASLKMGDLGEAHAAYYRALKVRPEFPAALDGLGRYYETRDDTQAAITHYKRSFNSDRGYAPAYTHLGDLYLRQDRVQEAVSLLEEAVSMRPDFAAGLNRLALAYGLLGLSNQAAATIQRAIDLQPLVADHPATLGTLQLNDGQIAAAEASFNRAIERDDTLAAAREGLAEIARRGGDYTEAITQIDQALTDPRNRGPLIVALKQRRADILEEGEQLSRLEAAVGEDALSPEEAGALAQLLAGRMLWEEAARMQALAPSTPEQQERLAYMLFRAGRYREALTLYDELSHLSEGGDPALNRGVTLVMLGDHAAAAEAFREVLATDDDHREARLYLANALYRLGQSAEAAGEYREFLDQGSKGEAAERVRRILQQIAPDLLPRSGPPPQEEEES